jgi:hypothetical protein
MGHFALLDPDPQHWGFSFNSSDLIWRGLTWKASDPQHCLTSDHSYVHFRLQLLTGPVQNLPLASAEPVPSGAPPARENSAARASIGYLQLRTQLLRQQLARGTDLQSTKSFSFTTGEEGGTTPAGSNLSTPSRNRGRPRSVSFQAVLSCGSGMGLPYFDPTPQGAVAPD